MHPSQGALSNAEAPRIHSAVQPTPQPRACADHLTSRNRGLAQALWGKHLVSILLTQQLSSPLNNDEEKGQMSESSIDRVKDLINYYYHYYHCLFSLARHHIFKNDAILQLCGTV